jgi:chromosome segregation ATPase
LGILLLHLASKADYENRLSESQVTNTQLSRKVAEQSAELEKVSVQLGEMKRLRRENKEIHELRAASADVLRLQKEKETMFREMEVLRSKLNHAQIQATQMQEQARDAQQALRQTQSVVNANAAQIQKNRCIANLKQIDGAKQQWAIENRKNARDTPTVAELFGPALYIKVEPVCPTGGGRYRINEVRLNPTCSHPDHKL